MPWNKISGGSSNQPGVPIGLAAGEVVVQPPGQGLQGTYGGISYPQLGTNNPLSGQYFVMLGEYTTLQVYDVGLQYWRNACVDPYGQANPVSADGYNYRVANSTGCPIGALITNAGTGLTNGWYGYNAQGAAITIQNGQTTLGNTTLTVAVSAGASLWNMIVGGAINTTIAITNAGTLYTRPPILVFSPPVNQGQQPYALPTATCTISGGLINAVTVTNQGAGLLGAPIVTVVPAPGDTTGGGAVLTVNATLAGSGTLTLMYPAYYGTAVTAVPTFTFTPASTTAATAVMNFTVTSFTQGTAGVAYVAAGGSFGGGYVAGTPVYTNPMYDRGLSIPIYPTGFTVAATTGLPSLAATGAFTGVNIQAVPTFSAYSSGAAPSTAAVTTVNVGGISDVFTLMSF